MDLSKLVSESIAEGRQAMEDRERELKAQLPATDFTDVPPNRPD